MINPSTSKNLPIRSSKSPEEIKILKQINEYYRMITSLKKEKLPYYNIQNIVYLLKTRLNQVKFEK